MTIRNRLYLLTTILGGIPLLTVGATVLMLSSARQESLNIEKLTYGSICLERINALINAAVMDSRGIYLSSSIDEARPSAEAVVRDVDQMRETLRDWRAAATPAEVRNIDLLSNPLHEFILRRNEIVHAALTSGVPAAVRLGDAERDRGTKAALTQSLADMERSYGETTVRARATLQQDETTLWRIAGGLVALDLLAFGFCLSVVRKSIVGPLQDLAHVLGRMAAGDLAVQLHSRGRNEISRFANGLSQLQTSLRDRERMARETRLRSDLAEWLQCCNSLSELYLMASEFFTRLMPKGRGALYVYANSRDALECATTWNGGIMPEAIHPDDCWALRRGRPYTFGTSEVGFACKHVGDTAPACTCCIPVLAHGETIGLLHLEFDREYEDEQVTDAQIADQRRIGIMCAEEISLAVANVKLRDQLRDQSIRDALTGLYNRRYLTETCRREFGRAQRTHESVSILSIDVDFFKKFNDNHGHDAGDTTLRAVARCMENCFRNDDVPCRFGGEEFVVLLPGADLDIAMHRAEEFRVAVESLSVRYLDSLLPRITVSIGVASYPEDGMSPEKVLKSADEALYLAKREGRNRVAAARSVRQAALMQSPVPSI